MLESSSSVSQLFAAAGWQANESRNSPRPAAVEDLAKAVIAEFSGLQVGSVGAGREQARSNVHFYSKPRPEVSAVVEPWHAKLGHLSAVATAHNDHIVIFVGCRGKYYAFTDSDEQLYSIGQTFGEAMERLLLGLSFGAAVSRDA